MAFFIVFTYLESWFPSLLKAASDDLNLYSCLQMFSKVHTKISQVRTKTLQRHIWYLTEELKTISLFDEPLPDDTRATCWLRRSLGIRLTDYVYQYRNPVAQSSPSSQLFQTGEKPLLPRRIWLEMSTSIRSSQCWSQEIEPPEWHCWLRWLPSSLNNLL